MKTYLGIDYEQRPASYWDDSEVLAALVRNVKGRERREMIRAYWEQGRLEDLEETLLRDTLSEEAREKLGRIHPRFMGGEYLPDYQGGEVEIARIELQSTTSDVISIRARRAGRLIRYRIVDEYETEFQQPQRSGCRPFTLGKLVRFIDASSHPELPSGLAVGYNEMNEEGTGERESLRHFTRMKSELYPQLEEHYEHVFEEWVREAQDLERD